MRQEPIRTIQGKHAAAHIYYDEYVHDSPRDWCNVTTMACAHRRYTLGDEQIPGGSGIEYLEDLLREKDEDKLMKLEEAYDEKEAALHRGTTSFGSTEYQRGIRDLHQEYEAELYEALEPFYEIQPLYLYDHSGITISTGRFSCPWDSGQVGVVWVDLERAAKEEVPDGRDVREWARQMIESEVDVYDQYLRGEVYGIVVEGPDGEHIDSCFGFYGDPFADERKEKDTYLVDEAKAMLEEADKDLHKRFIHDPQNMTPFGGRDGEYA